MTSASDPKKPEPPKKGRPEKRVSMTTEEAEKVLGGMLSEKPKGDEKGLEEPEEKPPK